MGKAIQDFKVDLIAVLARDKAIYITYAILIGLTTGLLMAFGLYAEAKYFLYGSGFTLLTLISFLTLSIAFFIKLIIQKHPSPIRAFKEQFDFLLKHPEEIIGFILLLSTTSFLFSAFTSLKSLIPSIQPFAYDALLANLDRTLHLGVDPWVITHNIFSSALASGILNLFYNLWFFLYWVVLFFFILRTSPKRERLQYLITHMLAWFIIGGLLATLMSSAGPPYYDHFAEGVNPFSPLIERLNIQNNWLENNIPWLKIWALNTQDLLWANYQSGDPALGSGISAMPSMHLSMAVLMALGMQKFNKYLAIFFWAFVIIIQIGSVHLGWHYAIDGYLAILITLLLWKIVGRMCFKLS